MAGKPSAVWSVTTRRAKEGTFSGGDLWLLCYESLARAKQAVEHYADKQGHGVTWEDHDAFAGEGSRGTYDDGSTTVAVQPLQFKSDSDPDL